MMSDYNLKAMHFKEFSGVSETTINDIHILALNPVLNSFPEGEALGQQMLVRARMENHVKCLVEEGNLVRRRSKYEAINSFDLTPHPRFESSS
jgi:hypothetical protein